jgi:peptidoglycan-associated lipoprotein
MKNNATDNRSHGVLRRWLALFTLALAGFGLGACSSSVKLDEPAQVESRSVAAPQSGAGAQTGSAGQGTPRPVDLTRPAGDERGPAVAHSVYFDYDSFVIKEEYKTTIDAHARYLRANPSKRVVLEGHTDERGGREYNLALGQKRSEAVRRSLVLLGVGEQQTEATSFGKEKPRAQGSDEASWAENRRVDFSYR